MNTAALEPPRWPGGPPICTVENLPALETYQALQEFHQKNGPSCKVVKTWHCPVCQRWHAETIAPDPAGNTSGTGRSSR